VKKTQTTDMGKLPKLNMCIIRVRYGGNGYMARALGHGITASCTMGDEQALQACADKVFGKGRWAVGWSWKKPSTATGWSIEYDVVRVTKTAVAV
jgi:hypothetical protein